jgi:hypothetical protein
MDKGYQGKDRILIIVPLFSSPKSNLLHQRRLVPFFNNIKILTSKQFASNLNYKGALLEKFFYSINTAKKAIFNDYYFNTLSIMAKKSHENLIEKSEHYPIQNDDFQRKIFLK